MILDTTFLVDLLRADPGARALLEELERGSDALRVPAPALARIAEALARSRQPPREPERLRGVLDAAPALPLTHAHAFRAGRLLAEHELDPFDALVAAMALEEDETLVTRNARDFGRIAGLRLRAY